MSRKKKTMHQPRTRKACRVQIKEICYRHLKRTWRDNLFKAKQELLVQVPNLTLLNNPTELVIIPCFLLNVFRSWWVIRRYRLQSAGSIQ